MTNYYDDVTTLYENFQRGKRVSSKCPPSCFTLSILLQWNFTENGPCLAERSSPTGPYEWISYGEVEERALAFGAGLAALGLEPGQDSCVGIYSQNNIEVSPTLLVCSCVYLSLYLCAWACAVGGDGTVVQLLLSCGGTSLRHIGSRRCLVYHQSRCGGEEGKRGAVGAEGEAFQNINP